MALKLSEEVKGLTADYWKITDCNVVTGQVCMALFADKEAAENRQNMLNGRTSFKVDFEITELDKVDKNPIKQAYLKIKESKMETKTVLDEDGKQTLDKDKKVITEEVETNKFAAAEDC